MDSAFALIHTPIVQGLLTGFLSAAAGDYAAFTRWKSFDECASYGWKIALWRWFQGAVIGAVSGAGIGSLPTGG